MENVSKGNGGSRGAFGFLCCGAEEDFEVVDKNPSQEREVLSMSSDSGDVVTVPFPAKVYTLTEKLSVIEHLTGGQGPIATAAGAVAISLSQEYDRHLEQVAWQLDLLERAWLRLRGEVGDDAIDLALNHGRRS